MLSIGERQEAGFAILDVRSPPVSVLQDAVMVEAVTTMSRQLAVYVPGGTGPDPVVHVNRPLMFAIDERQAPTLASVVGTSDPEIVLQMLVSVWPSMK